MRRNSITPFCAWIAAAECVNTFIPSATGVAQAGRGLGAFSTCTRHMRQLAVIAEVRDVDPQPACRLDDHGVAGHLDRVAVDLQIHVRHAPGPVLDSYAY